MKIKTMRTISVAAVLCMTIAMLCSCVKTNLNFTTDQLCCRVLTIGSDTLTVEIGTYNSSIKADRTNEKNFQSGLGINPDGFTKPEKSDEQTPPDMGEGQTPPDIPGVTIPEMPTNSGNDASFSKNAGFFEETNNESGFGMAGGSRLDGIKNGSSFVSSGVTIDLPLEKDAQVKDSSGNDAELQIGDIVNLKLNSESRITSVTIVRSINELPINGAVNGNRSESGKNDQKADTSDNSEKSKAANDSKASDDTQESDTSSRKKSKTKSDKKTDTAQSDDTESSSSTSKKKNKNG